MNDILNNNNEPLLISAPNVLEYIKWGRETSSLEAAPLMIRDSEEGSIK